MFKKQKQLRKRMIDDDITLDMFYDAFIRDLDVSYSRFKNMYYKRQPMIPEVENAINHYLDEREDSEEL
jgi:hypothetical protein